MALLSQSEGALLLRIGEALGALSAFDERVLGFTGFRNLVENEVDFDRTWAFRLRDFASSPLVAVKQAVCANDVPMSWAVEAPRDMSLEEQRAWIEQVRRGEMRPRKRAKSAQRRRVVLDDPESVRIVHEATLLARTLRGGNCREHTARRDVIDAYRRRADGRELVRKASEPREMPDRGPPIDWHTAPDPAAALLGPREVPQDAYEAREHLRNTLHKYRTRTLELGFLYQQVVDRKLYRRWGFGSVEEMVTRRLPITLRTLQNYRDRALELAVYPELLAATEAGMDFARAMLVYRVATVATIDRWLAVARRTTVMELRRAVAWAIETKSARVLERYEQAIAATKGAHQWVALRDAKRPEPVPKRIDDADPELLEACTWYLANVRLPKQGGFHAVKEREAWTCESPRCYTLTIRIRGHHRIWRSRGGGDEDSNAAAVCDSCHLRGIHPFEFVRIDRDGEGRDVWRYADGLEILVS
jgi:hypothetical protein